MSECQLPRRTRVHNALLGMSAESASLSFTPLPTVGGLSLAKEAEFEALLEASNHPAGGTNHLLRVRQVTALLKKNPHIAGCSPESRREAALAKFFRVQGLNRLAQKRLNYYFSHPSRMRPSINQLVSTASLMLFRLLGPEPGPDDWERFRDAKVFSSGVTQGLPFERELKTKDVDAYAKVLSSAVVTGSRRCVEEFGARLFTGTWGSNLMHLLKKGLLKVEESDSSILSLQPKDAEIDRAVFTEPSLNAMAQQGIRAMLEPYLKVWGITLDDQTGNRKLARVASVRGFSPDGFATIDLVSASDTNLTVLVKRLLPAGWFRICDAARTHYITVDGEVLETPMFTSMGNAFTFPVECLVFAALTKAAISMCTCTDPRFRVYGDDIIVPLSAAALLIEGLEFCGFHVNVEKSFLVGFFRESCGGDYIGGSDVRPVYLKGDISLSTEIYSLFNRIQAKDPAHPVLNTLIGLVRDPCIGPAIGPDGGETGHFVAPVFVLRKIPQATVRWDNSLQSYRYSYRSLTPSSRRRRRVDPMARLLATIAGMPGEKHDLRDTVRYRECVRVTTTPFVAAPTAPLWYSY